MLPFFDGNFSFWEAISSYFFRVTTSAQQLLFRSSYFFRTASLFYSFLEQSLFRRSYFFRITSFSERNFCGATMRFFVLKFHVITHVKNKESKKQSFRMCLNWWKNINKKGRRFFIPILQYCQFGQDSWKSIIITLTFINLLLVPI